MTPYMFYGDLGENSKIYLKTLKEFYQKKLNIPNIKKSTIIALVLKEAATRVTK